MSDQRVHTPSVSFIIPVVNEEAFIRRCLLSLLEQDYPSEKIEILVVDGNSEDTTAEIVTDLASSHKNIKLLGNPQRTIPAAMKIGIAHAEGELILRGEARAVYAWYYVSSCIEKMREVRQVLY